jgi:hypothetical protein
MNWLPGNKAHLWPLGGPRGLGARTAAPCGCLAELTRVCPAPQDHPGSSRSGGAVADEGVQILSEVEDPPADFH